MTSVTPTLCMFYKPKLFWSYKATCMGVMVINTDLNNIWAISWQPILLVEETGVPGENHRPVASYWQTLSHNIVSSTHRLSGIRTHNVSGNMDWLHTGSCKSNHHTITTTTAPFLIIWRYTCMFCLPNKQT